MFCHQRIITEKPNHTSKRITTTKAEFLKDLLTAAIQHTSGLLIITANSFSFSVIKQEMEEHHVPNDFKVSVKVDSTPGEDLIKVLEDMRQEYEFIIKKKHQDLDAWYKEQVKERSSNLPKVPFPCGANANASVLCLVS